MNWRLDGLIANVPQTAPNGAVNEETIFRFRQKENRVWAEYAGGLIERGYLVGLVTGNRFVFRYCQMQFDGTFDGGKSDCRLERSPEGLVRIVENFEWASRPGEKGTNIIQQLPERPTG
ncbi:MAG: hypothetical protein R2747_22325 [Pyrinomonadaceae bacterium]